MKEDYSDAPPSFLQTSMSESGAINANKVKTGHTSKSFYASACIDSSTKTATFSYFLKHTQTHSVQKYLSLFFFLLFLTHHISKVICCVISLCWPPAHEIQHLSLLLSPYNCFIFLHTGSSTGSCIILPRLNKAATVFFFFFLIYHFLYYTTLSCQAEGWRLRK